ncbi:hypothetical protein ACVXHA_21940 [Escherichia coli]
MAGNWLVNGENNEIFTSAPIALYNLDISSYIPGDAVEISDEVYDDLLLVRRQEEYYGQTVTDCLYWQERITNS